MAKPKAGAQLFTVREFTKTIEDIAETLKKVAAIGFTEVQVSGFGSVDMKEVGKLAKDNGLKVAATHTGWPRFLKELDAVIEDHKALGCDHPAVGGVPGEYRSSEGIKKFVDELGPVAEKLVAEGMDFSYHNHNMELVRLEDGRTWLATLYETASPDILKAEIDTYWIQAGGGDPAAWIRKCAGREPLVHFKDMAMDAERNQRFAEIGEGNLNWPAILAACEEGGVEHALVEQDRTYGRDPFECLAISYRNMKEMGLE